MKDVASDVQPVRTRIDRTSAHEPECTERVHEGESGIGAARSARSQRPATALPGRTAEGGRAPVQTNVGASPDQGHAVVFQRPARLCGLLLGALLLVCSTLARADNIFVQSVDLTTNSSEYFLSASFDIVLTPTVEDALNRGVPLHFLVEFEVIYPRWYTLYFWNKRIVQQQQSYRLSYNALTRQYRLGYGVVYQTFYTLDSALSVLGNIEGQQVFDQSELDDDRVYEAALRMRLDVERLPKPIQIDALGSDAWDVSSPWFRWTVQR